MNSNTRAVFIEGKKIEYWNHFLFKKKLWSKGITEKRLAKVKRYIWEDEMFWFDVLGRHGGIKLSPNVMRKINAEMYSHCFGNFASRLHDIMINNGIIKI